MRDKQGNKVTRKEFVERWKGGIQQITPLQQSRVSLIGSFFVITGVLIGIVTTILTRLWWLLVILIGSLFLTSMNILGGIQKYLALKKIDEVIKQQSEECEVSEKEVKNE